MLFIKGDQDQITALRRLLGAHEVEAEKILVQWQHHKPIMDALKSMISTLGGEPKGIPADEAEEAVVIAAAKPVTPVVTSLQVNLGTPTAQTDLGPNQKSKKMPPKLPIYSGMTTIGAAVYALQHSDKKMLHVDDLVFLIYGKLDREPFKAAKRSVVSEMIRGKEEKGIFRKKKPNTFMLAEKTSLNGDAESAHGG